MPKFIRKPTAIEAEQFWPDKKPWPRGVVEKLSRFDGEDYHGGYRIRTRYSGWLSVSPGDWIVKSEDGTPYPCKSDIFEKNYEPIVDELIKEAETFEQSTKNIGKTVPPYPFGDT